MTAWNNRKPLLGHCCRTRRSFFSPIRGICCFSRCQNKDTSFNIGPDDVACDVKVDSDELPLQKTRHTLRLKPVIELAETSQVRKQTSLICKFHMFSLSSSTSHLSHITFCAEDAVRGSRSAGQTEFQGCLWFPRQWMCEYVCSGLGQHVIHSRHGG